jgi:hypothetical protein
VKRGILILISVLAISVAASAQIRVFAGNGHYFTTLVLRLDNDRTLPAFSFNINEAFYTVVGNRIMEGPMGSEFDLVFTLRDNKLYRGTALYTSQIAYTFEEGRIYKGDSNFLIDILYNVKDNVIYNGANSFPTDALLLIEGRYTLPQLFAIMLSLELISR